MKLIAILFIKTHTFTLSHFIAKRFYGTSKRTFCCVWICSDETHFLLLDITSIANENTWVMKVEREKVFFQLPTTVWRHCSEQNEKIRVECLHYNLLRFERLHWSSVMFRIKWFPRSQFIPHFPSHSFDVKCKIRKNANGHEKQQFLIIRHHLNFNETHHSSRRKIPVSKGYS